MLMVAEQGETDTRMLPKILMPVRRGSLSGSDPAGFVELFKSFLPEVVHRDTPQNTPYPQILSGTPTPQIKFF